jgi:signal peptidase I
MTSCLVIFVTRLFCHFYFHSFLFSLVFFAMTNQPAPKRTPSRGATFRRLDPRRLLPNNLSRAEESGSGALQPERSPGEKLSADKLSGENSARERAKNAHDTGRKAATPEAGARASATNPATNPTNKARNDSAASHRRSATRYFEEDGFEGEVIEGKVIEGTSFVEMTGVGRNDETWDGGSWRSPRDESHRKDNMRGDGADLELERMEDERLDARSLHDFQDEFQAPLQDHLQDESSDERQGDKSLWRVVISESLQVIVPAVALALLVHLFLAQATVVYGQSMEPNLHEHERLIIDKLSYRMRAPQRNDIVVLDLPHMNELLVKRVIGLPGEVIEIRHGQVLINGEPAQESFPHDLGFQSSPAVTLGPLTYFVLGDNRENSNDSRAFGPIRRDDILGRVWLRYWPFSQFRIF